MAAREEVTAAITGASLPTTASAATQEEINTSNATYLHHEEAITTASHSNDSTLVHQQLHRPSPAKEAAASALSPSLLNGVRAPLGSFWGKRARSLTSTVSSPERKASNGRRIMGGIQRGASSPHFGTAEGTVAMPFDSRVAARHAALAADLLAEDADVDSRFGWVVQQEWLRKQVEEDQALSTDSRPGRPTERDWLQCHLDQHVDRVSSWAVQQEWLQQQIDRDVKGDGTVPSEVVIEMGATKASGAAARSSEQRVQSNSQRQRMLAVAAATSAQQPTSHSSSGHQQRACTCISATSPSGSSLVLLQECSGAAPQIRSLPSGQPARLDQSRPSQSLTTGVSPCCLQATDEPPTRALELAWCSSAALSSSSIAPLGVTMPSDARVLCEAATQTDADVRQDAAAPCSASALSAVAISSDVGAACGTIERSDEAVTCALSSTVGVSAAAADAVQGHPSRLHLRSVLPTVPASETSADRRSFGHDMALWEMHNGRSGEESCSHRVFNPYVGIAADGLSTDGGYTANAGLNVWRYGSASTDLGVGVRVDTGVAVSDATVRGYLMGFGGEMDYEQDGSVSRMGISLGLVKLNVRRQNLQTDPELVIEEWKDLSSCP